MAGPTSSPKPKVLARLWPTFCIMVLAGLLATSTGYFSLQDTSSLGRRWSVGQDPLPSSANQSDDFEELRQEPREELQPQANKADAEVLANFNSVKKSDNGQIQICNPCWFGAVGDGKTDNTEAFRTAMELCSANRSWGTERFILQIPKGIFVLGSVNLTSKMTLRLLKGSKLLGVSSPDSYPLLPALPSYGLNRDWSLDPSKRHSALLFGYNLSDVTIEGPGVIDGNGSWWWSRFSKTHVLLQHGRPSLIQCMFCSNITLRRIRLQNPAFWNTHFYASKKILVERVNITAPYDSPNTDGINLDSVVHAIVRNSEISTGDDAIAIKSGLNQAGINFAMPSAHIHLHDLAIRSKCLSVGSEMSGGVYDIRVENVKFGDSRPENRWHGIFIKSSRWRGGVVRDLYFHNIYSVARSGIKRQTKVFIKNGLEARPRAERAEPLGVGLARAKLRSNLRPSSTLPSIRSPPTEQSRLPTSLD